jgi:type I restriction enzyme S subunit
VSDGKEAARLPAGKAGAGGARRYKPYPAYKDSGVEWLGEIPAHWEVKRITELMAVVNGFPFDSEHFVRGDGVPLVRIRDLCGTETEVNYTGPIVEDAWIETGDLIVGMDGDFNVARWRGSRALLNQRMCCLRARSGTNPGFVAYLLPMPLKVINELTYSTTVKHLSSNDVRKVRLGFPPEPEQRAIAAFLDRETARIDALVAKKERLIALLQEQRTALISDCVTGKAEVRRMKDENGNSSFRLHPSSLPKKDSGVEWLGEIPAHWEVKKVKRLCLVRRGASPRPIDDPIYFDDEGEYAWVRIADVTASDRYLERTTQRLSTLGKSKSVALEPGELFVSIAATVGKPVITKIKCCIHDGFVYFVGLRENRDFLFYLFSCGEAYRGLGKLGTQLNLNTDTIGDIYLPRPSSDEQQAIVQFLDRETARIDALIAKVREAIERLKELRTALISAAVTGKIDVREEAE